MPARAVKAGTFAERGDRRKNPGNQGGGAHHQRCRRRADKCHRLKRTGEACCPNFWTRSLPVSRSQASPPLSWFDCKPREGPPEVPPRSCRPARTPSPGSPTPREQSRATKPCAHHAASVEPSGDDGAAITAGAASRHGPGQKTIRGDRFPGEWMRLPSNCSASDWPRGTSTVRPPSSGFVSPS